MVAGEVSGDVLAAPAIRTIRQHEPKWRIAGIAGDQMIDAGCEPWHHVRELSVRGYAEVLRARGQLVPSGETVQMGVPPESAQFVRGADEMLGLLGARCVDCGTINTPPTRRRSPALFSFWPRTTPRTLRRRT